MRASTVFLLALALMVGLAAAAGARYTGVFARKEVVALVEKPPVVLVLVSRVNLFEDIAVLGNQVDVRELAADDQAEFARTLGPTWRDKLMPPMPSAVNMRVPKALVPAGRALLRDYFTDPSLPEALTVRLEPNTRAVGLLVAKDKVGGGQLRVGEHVDVLLTSKVGKAGREELRTACIARGCKVVMKRSSLWTVMAADPDDKPVQFTLQANTYRAALIEHARTHGDLCLLPAPPPVRTGGSFADPASKEYALEDQRVEAFNRGELSIGDRDLTRVFNVPPPAPTADRTPPVFTRHLVGVRPAGVTVLVPGSTDGPLATPAPAQPAAEDSASFRRPTDAECKTCEDNKRRAGGGK